MTEGETFGEYLRHRRATVLNGLSLRDTADGSGLSYTMLGQYENNQSLPAEKNLPKVAKAYRVELPELLELYRAARSGEARALPSRYGKLSQESFRALLAHAEVLLSLQNRGRPLSEQQQVVVEAMAKLNPDAQQRIADIVIRLTSDRVLE